MLYSISSPLTACNIEIKFCSGRNRNQSHSKNKFHDSIQEKIANFILKSIFSFTFVFLFIHAVSGSSQFSAFHTI